MPRTAVSEWAASQRARTAADGHTRPPVSHSLNVVMGVAQLLPVVSMWYPPEDGKGEGGGGEGGGDSDAPRQRHWADDEQLPGLLALTRKRML